MEIYRLAKFSSISLELGDFYEDFYLPPVLLPFPSSNWTMLRSSRDYSEYIFARIASVVIPRANKHHMSSRIRNFMIILWICWTSRFKIYKDLYSCPPDLWPVAGPSEMYYYTDTGNLCNLHLSQFVRRGSCITVYLSIIILHN